MAYIALPSGAFTKIREGETEQDAWVRAQKEHPNEFTLTPAKPEKQPEGGFIPALSAGLSRLAGETALTAGKLGILDLPRAEELYSLQQRKAEQIFKPAEGGWTESPWQKFKETAGGSLAYMLAPAAAGIAGAAAPVSVPLIGAAGLGAGLVSLGQFTGSNIAAQMAEGKTLEQASGATAAIAAVPQAALDVLSFRMIPGLQRFFGAAGKEITEAQAKALAEQTLKQKIGDYAVATGRTMGVEGVTEVAQDVIEKLQAGAEIADPKAREDYLESLIGGAALAAVLGPVGRFAERGGIQARGRELEKERLTAEAAAREKAQQEALAAQTEFRLAPPEGPMGPDLPAATQTQRIQARLAEIENEVAAARQAKDMDALLNLMRERNTLEAQAEELAPEQTAFERRRGMEQQQSALESLEAQLQAAARQATNVADKRAVLERLVAVQQQRRDLAKEFERAEAKGEIPTLVEHKKLLDAEKRALKALQAAEEKGDAAGQLKAAAKLEELQGQLGLFGMESFAAQEQDAARSRAQEALQASGRTLRLPAPVAPTIPMGLNTNLFSTAPYGEMGLAAPSQETLFGPPERQYEVSTEQAGMPQRQLEQAVSTLATKPDLTPEDRSLLERVQAVATPAPGLRTDEVLQGRLRSLQELRSKLEAELLARGDKALKADEAAAAEEGVEPEEVERLSDREKLRILRQLAAPRPAAGKRPGDVSADLPAQRGQYALQGDPKLAALIKRLDRLDQIEAEFRARLAAADRTPLTLLERLSTTGAARARERVAQIQKEIDALERGAQAKKPVEVETTAQVQAKKIPSVQTVLSALQNKVELGRGGNAIVYDIFGTDFVLRVPKGGDPFAVNAPKGSALPTASDEIVAIADPFDGKNFGQPVATIGQSQILRRQNGTPAGLDSIKNLTQEEADARYAAAVKAAAAMPQSAFDKFAADLVFLNSRGASFDPSKSSNVLIDSNSGQFKLVDINQNKNKGFNNSFSNMLVTLMGSSYVYKYKGSEDLKPAYRKIYDKSLIAAKKTGLEIRAGDSSVEYVERFAEIKNGLTKADAQEAPKAPRIRGTETPAEVRAENVQRQERIAQLKEEQAGLWQEAVSLRQRITDWLSDTARGRDNTNSRQALEDALQQVEAAQRGEKEALTTTRRRIATPEERALLGGKKTVVEKTPTEITVEAQQPDLFAGTEAARAVEFETPKQFQKFMASDELNKLRRQQGLLKPTVAYLQKQAQKIEAVLARLNKRLENFKWLRDVRTEEGERALKNAKQQYAEVVHALLMSLPKQHAQYAYAKLELENAKETYDGLASFQKAVMTALDRDLAADSAWAQIDRAEKERFLAELQGPKQNLEAAIEKLAAMREQIAKAQIGEATDPYTALWPEYSAAQKEAQKAYEAFQKVIRERKKVTPPANAVVASKEIQNFLVQDAELTEMLIAQQREVYKFERILADANDKLEAAKKEAKQDPVWSAFLNEAQEAIDAARSWQIPARGAATEVPLTVPVKLQEAIRKANTQLNLLRQQNPLSPGGTKGEIYARYTDPQRAVALIKELIKLQKEQDKLVKDARQIAFLVTGPEKRQRQERIVAIQQELASLDRYKLSRREQRLETVAAEEQSQQKTRDEMRAENERLAREAEATTRVTFAPLRPEQQRALDEAKQQLDTLIKNKQAAIEKKETQTDNFRLSDERKKVVAEKKKIEAAKLAEQKKAAVKDVKAGKKTKEAVKKELEEARKKALAEIGKVRAEVVEAQRADDIKKISDMFDTQIEQKQAQIRAIRGVSRPSERREAQARQTQALQRQIGKPVKMSEEMQEALLTDAEKKAIDEGTKTLEQVMEARGRVGRTGPIVVDVRTGRVSETRPVPSNRDLTKILQEIEYAQANRLSAAWADKTVPPSEPTKTTRRKPTTQEQEKLAATVAEGVTSDVGSGVDFDPALLKIESRITSSEYAARENTPLDDTTTAAVNKGNLIQALTSLAENGSTPFVRMVAQRLLPMVENTSLETASLEGKGGEFDPNTNTITLNKDALTEEDLLHEAGHAATNAVASYEPKEFGMTRRQFLKGAASGLTAMKLPSIGENLSLDAQERLFFEMLDGWRSWTNAANKLAPALKLDPYINLNVADRDLRGFLTELEYNEVSDHAVVELLENGGLKKLQSAINASQRAIMAEATKTGEGKAEARKETFTPTKEQLDARTALEKLYAKMQSRPEFKDEYANVSFKEFVSELLSNQQVRDKINQTAGLLRRIYEGFLRMLGIEPTTLSDKAVEQAFAMFSPSQATLNREERLSSIMRGVFPGTSTKFSSAVPQGVQDAVNKTIARTATLGDKLMANTMGLRLRTFIADQWAPVEALLKMGVEKGKIKEAQALQMRVYMRLFSNQQEYTNAALLNGVPELMKDKTGVRNIEGGDEKANARTIAAALSKAKALGNEQAIERVFTLWMASLRAQQDGVGFEKLNFKNPPTAAELAALDQMFKDNPEVKAAFDEARALYKEHNKRLLNLQVQTGAMSQDVANELSKGDYIGYYRVNNNGVVELMLGGSRPMRIGSVVDQPYLKELVGGEQHILPFFSSMVQNTSMLMTIALKNMQNTNTSYMFQDLGLGKIHSVPDGKQPPMGKIRFKQGGNDYWFEADESAFEAAGVPADLMMQGLQGVKTAVPALVRGLAVPANFLRKAIRRVPIYTLRQTIRDPMHAWMVTGGEFTPILGTWKELAKGMTGKSDTQLTLQQAAVIGNNVYSGDAEGVADMLRTLTSEPSKFSQTMMKFDEFAMRGESATRAVLYDMFRKKGMGHVEALLNTAETMNFSRRGTSASLAWLSMLTPFFNAQIQGLDSVYRALKGDSTFEEKMNARNTLLKRGALMFISSMFYAWLMEDDEAYKNATPAERYGNWFVRVPGTDKTVRVPIPFELGLIFKSMPEAFMNTAFGDTKASEAAKAIGKQIWMSTPGGIPTAVKGPIELMANYSFYNDQPIETDREKAMDVDQRYRTGTTELAKLLGKAGVLSPVQIDHLVRSYLSSAGIVLASMANFALRPLTSREGVEKPEMALEEMPLFGSMFQPRTGRGMVNAAFDDMHRIERAANTYKTLAASDPKAAQEYANDYAREIGLASFAGRFRQQMGEFAKYKRMIAANPDLTPAEKRQQIEAVKEQEIRYSTMLRKFAA